MVSVHVAGDRGDARALVTETEVFTLAESLGGVESLLEHPARMTNAAVPAEERQATGLGDALVRLSVGLEDLADLRAALDRALAGGLG